MVAKDIMMPAPRKYPDELHERAVRLVREDGQHGAIPRVADRLDINRETLRNWVTGERRSTSGCSSWTVSRSLPRSLVPPAPGRSC